MISSSSLVITSTLQFGNSNMLASALMFLVDPRFVNVNVVIVVLVESIIYNLHKPFKMIEHVNSFIFSHYRLTGNVPSYGTPKFASGQDMHVDYVHNIDDPNQFAIIINNWFYRILPDGSLKIDQPFDNYANAEFTVGCIQTYLKSTGGYKTSIPTSNLKLWFGTSKYKEETMSFIYHGISYHIHW